MANSAAVLGALQAPDVDSTSLEINITPLKVAELTNSKSMPECHEHHEVIPLAVSTLLGCLEQFGDFGFS